MITKIYTLPYGLKFKLVKEIEQSWSEYFVTIAKTHLANVGWRILDPDYNHPIDNEYDLDEIYEMIDRLGLSSPKPF